MRTTGLRSDCKEAAGDRMKIVLTANLVPFMPGGADYHICGLECALRQRGHEVVSLRFPFRFFPVKDIFSLMDLTRSFISPSLTAFSLRSFIYAATTWSTFTLMVITYWSVLELDQAICPATSACFAVVGRLYVRGLSPRYESRSTHAACRYARYAHMPEHMCRCC